VTDAAQERSVTSAFFVDAPHEAIGVRKAYAMERNLPEQCGRDVLAVFKSNRVAAVSRCVFPSSGTASLRPVRRFSDLSDGIYFLIQHGHLTRGVNDFEAYHLTDSGAQVIAGQISLAVKIPAQAQAAPGARQPAPLSAEVNWGGSRSAALDSARSALECPGARGCPGNSFFSSFPTPPGRKDSTPC
jgi:hypothetical protein